MEHRNEQDVAIVSSAGEEESDHHASSEEEEEEASLLYGDPACAQNAAADPLYGDDLDAQDEAWVYKHMRGGVEETVTIQRRPGQLEQAKLLKPRTSDAVLSCPCCFCIVCMDCQRHERFENQYRAMFVMNIGVNWNSKLVYCDKSKILVEKQGAPAHHVPSDMERNQEEEEVYYPVYCLNCQTQVAALDMRDEVYHFFGCLASA